MWRRTTDDNTGHNYQRWWTIAPKTRIVQNPWNRIEPSSNRALPSSKNPHFQNEVKCTTFRVKKSFTCMRMKNHFHIKGWALNLVLIQRSGELGNGLLRIPPFYTIISTTAFRIIQIVVSQNHTENGKSRQRTARCIGHFGVAQGTGASFKFQQIDKLTPH